MTLGNKRLISAIPLTRIFASSGTTMVSKKVTSIRLAGILGFSLFLGFRVALILSVGYKSMIPSPMDP